MNQNLQLSGSLDRLLYNVVGQVGEDTFQYIVYYLFNVAFCLTGCDGRHGSEGQLRR